jgi:hypothetical protein
MNLNGRIKKLVHLLGLDRPPAEAEPARGPLAGCSPTWQVATMLLAGLHLAEYVYTADAGDPEKMKSHLRGCSWAEPPTEEVLEAYAQAICELWGKTEEQRREIFAREFSGFPYPAKPQR